MSKETTFTNYTAAQGQHYAQARPDYHASVYDFVLQHAKAATAEAAKTGSTLAVDLGCGPGNVARALAPHFDRVVGIDPGDGMLATARQLADNQDIRNVSFEKGTASSLGELLPEDGVDLIASGNAAHWFDMADFWPAAARVVRPGGIVALWTTGGLSVHPDTIKASQLQIIMDEYQKKLEPYYSEGNRVVRDCYKDLVKPWDVGVSAFPRDSFVTKEWSLDEQFLQTGGMVADMATLQKVMSTASPYTRWCEANPHLHGTDQELLAIVRREIEAVQQAAGVEPGKESVRGVSYGVVLIFKKTG